MAEKLKANTFSIPMSSSDIPAESILSRTLMQNEEVKVVLFHFAPGQELSEHTASMPAILQQITGRALWKLGDHEMEATPGVSAYMEANLPHSIVAREDTMMVLFLLKGMKKG
jgi:quercetin dioxygenase-like cupin family protein